MDFPEKIVFVFEIVVVQLRLSVNDFKCGAIYLKEKTTVHHTKWSMSGAEFMLGFFLRTPFNT